MVNIVYVGGEEARCRVKRIGEDKKFSFLPSHAKKGNVEDFDLSAFATNILKNDVYVPPKETVLLCWRGGGVSWTEDKKEMHNYIFADNLVSGSTRFSQTM